VKPTYLVSLNNILTPSVIVHSLAQRYSEVPLSETLLGRRRQQSLAVKCRKWISWIGTVIGCMLE